MKAILVIIIVALALPVPAAESEPVVTDEVVVAEVEIEEPVAEEAEVVEAEVEVVEEGAVVDKPLEEVDALTNGAPEDAMEVLPAEAELTHWEEPLPELEMTPESAHVPRPPTVQTVAVWRVMRSGLARGFANLTLSPGELVRGFTYEYSAKKWYVAAGTSLLAAIGGTGSRACAGAADVVTCGYFGDVQLAEGYPDYVWQGDWFCPHPPPTSTKDTSSSGPIATPEQDIMTEVAGALSSSNEPVSGVEGDIDLGPDEPEAHGDDG